MLRYRSDRPRLTRLRCWRPSSRTGRPASRSHWNYPSHLNRRSTDPSQLAFQSSTPDWNWLKPVRCCRCCPTASSWCRWLCQIRPMRWSPGWRSPSPWFPRYRSSPTSGSSSPLPDRWRRSTRCSRSSPTSPMSCRCSSSGRPGCLGHPGSSLGRTCSPCRPGCLGHPGSSLGHPGSTLGRTCSLGRPGCPGPSPGHLGSSPDHPCSPCRPGCPDRPGCLGLPGSSPGHLGSAWLGHRFVPRRSNPSFRSCQSCRIERCCRRSLPIRCCRSWHSPKRRWWWLSPVIRRCHSGHLEPSPARCSGQSFPKWQQVG